MNPGSAYEPPTTPYPGQGQDGGDPGDQPGPRDGYSPPPGYGSHGGGDVPYVPQGGPYGWQGGPPMSPGAGAPGMPPHPAGGSGHPGPPPPGMPPQAPYSSPQGPYAPSPGPSYGPPHGPPYASPTDPSPQGPSSYGPPQVPFQGPAQGAPPQGPPPQGPPYYGPPPPQMPPTAPTLPQAPSAPGPPGRRGWLMPALAAGVVVLVAAGGVGVFVLTSRDDPAGSREADGRPAASSSAAPASGAKGPDVCGMLPKEEAERLVPGATVAKSSRDGEFTVDFGCNWVNRRISFGEYWRSREIDVKIAQYRGEGAKTGRALAQNAYEVEYRGGKYAATAKPSLDPDEKEYISPLKDIPGVGEGAFAQYTWRRDKLLWYSFGTANARVGDFTIKVKFQADQQKKDAQILSSETRQSITEANALREVSGLVAYFAKGVAAWQAKNPNVLAKADQPAVTSSPSPKASASPTVLAAFPAFCTAVGAKATELVPSPTTRARGLEEGGDSQTECRWLNLDLPGDGADTKKIRSVLITVHRFSDRTGQADVSGAKSYYATQRGGDKNMAGSSLGGITWGKLVDRDDLGDQAYQQFVQTRHSDVAASSGSVLMRKGAVVVRVDYSGHQRPKDAATNSPKVRFMSEKEAMGGALPMARAFMEEMTRRPVGS